MYVRSGPPLSCNPICNLYILIQGHLGRGLLQAQTCNIGTCQSTYGNCNSYAGNGCSTGSCAYTGCSINPVNRQPQCTWLCLPYSSGYYQPSVPCPLTSCGDCSSSYKSRDCPSRACVWSSCMMDLGSGLTNCNPTCLPSGQVRNRLLRSHVPTVVIYQPCQAQGNVTLLYARKHHTRVQCSPLQVSQKQ
jgi:hypothetical protein